MRVALAMISFLLAGCEAIDRPAMSSFEPNADGTFRFEAMKGADGIYSDEDRLGWLQTYLNNNDMCRDGYSVLETKNVLVQKAWLGDVYRQIIYGKCN